jgi:hypothetical protein
MLHHSDEKAIYRELIHRIVDEALETGTLFLASCGQVISVLFPISRLEECCGPLNGELGHE